MNSIFMKLYVTWPTSHTSEIWIFEVIFVVFRLMKNIIFNKTESFVGRNTSDHACQIFCSKSNCETMYHWFFLLEITVVKMRTIWMFSPPTAIQTHGPGLRRSNLLTKSINLETKKSPFIGSLNATTTNRQGQFGLILVMSTICL